MALAGSNMAKTKRYIDLRRPMLKTAVKLV